MQDRSWIIIAVFILLLVIVQYLAQSTPSLQIPQDKKLIVLNISGGIASMQIEVDYFKDGIVHYNNSRTHFQSSVQIPQPLVEEITNRLNILISRYPNGLILEAEPGSADYFTYRLQTSRESKLILYQWTDTSKAPVPLNNLASLLFQVNNYLARGNIMILFVRVDKFEYKVGDRMILQVIVINPTKEDYYYQSPTSCTPDFKVVVQTPYINGVEIFPVGVEIAKPCIQVIQERVINGGSMAKLEYEFRFDVYGMYIIKADFPYAEWSKDRYEEQIIVIVGQL